tara:strand:+ start:5484 stop:8972 length:3489 start_codon:yes stop_codon:yes gene_type:complete
MKCLKSLLVVLALVSGSLQLSAQNFLINENFNQGSLPIGWQNSALSGTQGWSFGIDGATAHGSNQNLDGTSFAYFDDDALGQSSANNHAVLVSPSFDNSALVETILEFDYNFRAFSAISDSFMVEVFDGSQWQMVLSRTTDDCGNYLSNTCMNGFPHAQIDITAYKNVNCQVRFRYFDGNNPNDYGWYVGIDNVEIYAPFANDIEVTSILTPTTSCGLSSSEKIQVEIVNLGANTLNSFPIAFAINGTEIATEVPIANLAYKDTLIYQFISTANLSQAGQYQITAYSKLPGDGNLHNDTSSKVVESFPLYNLPYSNDFETSTQDWMVSGQNASWQKGIPTAAPINSAASGTQAWVTNLSGFYNNGEHSYLTSPCFDFSSLTVDPIVRFDLIYQTEINHDFAWLEYSTDNGLSWTKVLANSFASNWYNNTNAMVWEGNSNGWLDVINVIPGLAGQSSVKLRLVFNSDLSGPQNGIGFDNFRFYEPIQTDIEFVKSISPQLDSSLNCPYGSETLILGQIKNYGKSDTFNISFNYQVNNSAIFSSNHRVYLNTLEEKVIVSDSTFDFDPTSNYQFKSWVIEANDINPFNDSIAGTILNTSTNGRFSNFPIYEDFSNSSLGTISNNISFQPTNNIVTTSTKGWQISDGMGVNHNPNTAPLNGMNGSNSNFVYFEASGTALGEQYYLESPCLVLPKDSSVKISFGYHKYGSQMGNLKLEISQNDGNWTTLETILGQTHTSRSAPWLSRTVSLSQFAGQVVKIRFTAVSGGGTAGDMAIDNISIRTSESFHFIISDLSSPQGSCTLSDSTEIAINLVNLGDSTLLADSVNLYYQVNNGVIFSEKLQVPILGLSTQQFTFASKADMSQLDQTLKLKVWADYPNLNLYTDTLEKYFKTYSIQYFENFEDFSLGIIQNSVDTSWTSPNAYSNPQWAIADTIVSNLSGPIVDHTFGTTARGKFIYTNSTFQGGYELNSPCIDLRNTSQAELNLWINNYGIQSGTQFRVDIENYTFQGSNHVNSYLSNAIIHHGPYQNSNNAPWALENIDLSSSIGNRIKLNFEIYTIYVGNVFAFDDISIVDSSLITSINPISQNQSWKVEFYPNPSKGVYYFKNNDHLKGNSYQILDIKGQMIQEGNLRKQNNQIDLSDSPAGIYFLQINELGIREKLIKY